ncbi:MAG: IniB N-terminal domain-containing protein, partial [Actinobacteria bacterium]|nr:IniB N-terminal domain-containing protein [Actinomycetota bacterium]
MENVATTLLDFILNLLDDPEAMAAFVADREGALTAAGLGGCGDEVDAALTTAGGGLSYASATFDWHDHSDSDAVFFNRVSDDDGIDDSFNRIEDSFNTTVT